MLTQNHIKFGILMQLAYFMFFIEYREMHWSYKKCQKIGVGKGAGPN